MICCCTKHIGAAAQGDDKECIYTGIAFRIKSTDKMRLLELKKTTIILGLFHQQILLLTIHSSSSRLVFMEIKSVLPAPMLSELFKKVLASWNRANILISQLFGGHLKEQYS